jgi:hypothetical protein
VLLLGGAGGLPTLGTLAAADTATAVLALIVALLAGLILAAAQTPLYRVLEGYLGWPPPLAARARRRLLRRKHLLLDRVNAAVLAGRERDGSLDERGAAALSAMRAHPTVGRYVARDLRRGAVRLALLDERLQRFPVDDEQVVPTRLGNAIRRLEEYGYHRFRLDSQVFWYELTAVAPERAVRQVDAARTTVDFLVCLIYGHLVVAVLVLSAGAGPVPRWVGAGGLLLLSMAWYRVAVVATDDWAAAVRALANLGRLPLADALGLAMPGTVADERTMWELASGLARTGEPAGASALDRYRTGAPPGPVSWPETPAGRPSRAGTRRPPPPRTPA